MQPVNSGSSLAPLAPLVIRGELFRRLDAHLLTLLRSLSGEDWNRPTVCSGWSVKDIASHLLDTALRRLSGHRDGYRSPESPIGFGSNAELVAYIHRSNAEWTSATRRLSPEVLIMLTEMASAELASFVDTLDPMAKAMWPVAWAGETESKNWMDVAREYTERWHHQQQITSAVGGGTTILSREFYHPTLSAFVRALPITFQTVRAEPGTAVSFAVVGDAGGEWFVVREEGGWSVGTGYRGTVAAKVTVPQDVAWLMLTKKWDRATKLKRCPGIRTEGDESLALTAVETIAIMA